MRGTLAIAEQKIQVGIGRAGRILTVEEVDTTFRVHDGDELIVEVPRTTTKAVARLKARKTQPRRNRKPLDHGAQP